MPWLSGDAVLQGEALNFKESGCFATILGSDKRAGLIYIGFIFIYSKLFTA